MQTELKIRNYAGTFAFDNDFRATITRIFPKRLTLQTIRCWFLQLRTDSAVKYVFLPAMISTLPESAIFPPSKASLGLGQTKLKN